MATRVNIYKIGNPQTKLNVFEIDAQEHCKPGVGWTRNSNGKPGVAKVRTSVTANGVDLQEFTVPQLLAFAKDAEIDMPGKKKTNIISNLISAGYQPKLLEEEDEDEEDDLDEEEDEE